MEGKDQKQKGSLSPSEGKRTAGENRFDNILKRSVRKKRRTVMCVNEVFTPACIDERVRRRETDDDRFPSELIHVGHLQLLCCLCID